MNECRGKVKKNQCGIIIPCVMSPVKTKKRPFGRFFTFQLGFSAPSIRWHRPVSAGPRPRYADGPPVFAAPHRRVKSDNCDRMCSPIGTNHMCNWPTGPLTGFQMCFEQRVQNPKSRLTNCVRRTTIRVRRRGWWPLPGAKQNSSGPPCTRCMARCVLRSW